MTAAKQVRAQYTQEFKLEAVRQVTLPLFRVVLNPRFTRPFYAVPRTSAARIS